MSLRWQRDIGDNHRRERVRARERVRERDTEREQGAEGEKERYSYLLIGY